MVAKAHVGRVASDSLPPGVTRVFTTPTPLNAVLWRIVAMTGDGRYLEGYYSLLDAESRVAFKSRPDGHDLLDPLRGDASVARLVWFSRGFFSGRELGNGEIVISDLRMGLEERPVFSFVVGRRAGDAIEPLPAPPAPGSGGPARNVDLAGGTNSRPLRAAGVHPAVLSRGRSTRALRFALQS